MYDEALAHWAGGGGGCCAKNKQKKLWELAEGPTLYMSFQGLGVLFSVSRQTAMFVAKAGNVFKGPILKTLNNCCY